MRTLRHLHHRPQLQLSCATKQATCAEQTACSLKLRFGVPRQKPQNDIGVNGNQRTCPHAARALAATALQRMRLPLSCGASMPATSSTLRRATAFRTASPLRTSHCTASLAVMCKAVSTLGGTDKTIVCSAFRINLPLVMKINFIVSEPFNSHDGQINSQNASYTWLRVWRDLNQDGPSTSSGQGVSQAGELQTLSQAGIASIGAAGMTTNVNLAVLTNGCTVGNTQIASGGFTRTNGSTGQSGTAELTGSYLLAGNNRRYLISSCSRNILLICRPKRRENYLTTLKDHVLGTTCRARYVRVRTN